ncbi:MAG: glycine cleavage system aminomethyltransferase GcvT [Candidatus Sumerlaeaceae bacterium]
MTHFSPGRQMRETVLHGWHLEHGACMTDFNGWHMPLYYKGITEEHLHTRSKAGLFDLGHMGRVRIAGAGAKDFIDRLTPAKVGQGRVGDVQYSFMLNERGGVIDDITIYYDNDFILLIINAGGRERDVAWIQEQAANAKDVEVTDLSDAWGMVAIQGPNSQEVVQKLFGAETILPEYYCFSHLDDTIGPGPLIVSATGYTGERGFEFYLPQDNVSKLWEALLELDSNAEVWPIGLGARDSLRLEAAMPLYGHELNEDRTPLHAGLSRFVDLDKPFFIGREPLMKLRERGASERLVAFEMQQRGPVARQGFEVKSSDGASLGQVTSGIFSPTLQKVIGMAYVSADQAKTGSTIQIDVRGRLHPATIVKRPFYKRRA